MHVYYIMYNVSSALTNFTQPVYVSREDPNSRENTIKEIRDRARDKGKWPQIVIFPEGTCTNRKSLITFKPGTHNIHCNMTNQWAISTNCTIAEKTQSQGISNM